MLVFRNILPTYKMDILPTYYISIAEAAQLKSNKVVRRRQLNFLLYEQSGELFRVGRSAK